MKRLWFQLGAGLALATALSACPAANGTQTGGSSGGATNAPTAYTMSGTVRDAQGKPLPGVEVFADNTLYYDMNALGTTDANGRYSISLPKNELGTWKPGAHVEREYHGVYYRFRIYADDESAFNAPGGATRHFVWRLSGKHAGSPIGAVVYVYGDYTGADLDLERTSVTLTPDGPLVDGSAGATITRSLIGGQLDDIPVGRYTMTARYQTETGAIENLLVKPKNGSSFQPSATDDFQNGMYGVTMEFIVKRAE